MKVQKIIIEFPFPVQLPKGFEQALSSFVNLVCSKYEEEYPGRVMWPAGHGSKPIWDEPNEPDFDDTIFCIEVCEREEIIKPENRRKKKYS